MSKKPAKKGNANKSETPVSPEDPWISPRAGKITIAILSVAVAVWMTWQITPALGLGEALLWGVGFGASIWFIFYGMQLFQRWLRRR